GVLLLHPISPGPLSSALLWDIIPTPGRLLPNWGNIHRFTPLLTFKVAGFPHCSFVFGGSGRSAGSSPNSRPHKERRNMKLRSQVLTVVLACATYGVAQTTTPDQSQQTPSQTPSSTATTQQQTPSQQQPSNQSATTPSSSQQQSPSQMPSASSSPSSTGQQSPSQVTPAQGQSQAAQPSANQQPSSNVGQSQQQSSATSQQQAAAGAGNLNINNDVQNKE